ncbi:hypothetical protein HID58_094801 [Brassica napus]|uniref:Uncharacterized protein n=1 Tax=Brassica napus TaxID=3708 RepID=A0ABQ7X8I9_BRANA|nr:hypothetical protein HID58_094801 [Brassica napus]
MESFPSRIPRLSRLSLDPFWTRVSSHSAREYPHASPNDVGQKVIAEKGFYFLLSPRSGRRASTRDFAFVSSTSSTFSKRH